MLEKEVEKQVPCVNRMDVLLARFDLQMRFGEMYVCQHVTTQRGLGRARTVTGGKQYLSSFTTILGRDTLRVTSVLDAHAAKERGGWAADEHQLCAQCCDLYSARQNYARTICNQGLNVYYTVEEKISGKKCTGWLPAAEV